ncbi:hypothetical protein C7401_11488 [Paraburkholderia unamae]|uniref:flavodoxin family protein n=1 Tax=Paraburkholderia unamae TaxID=219649 RepID=UPI000DC45BF9|nr:flavodoxin family protein [Paraburkholderia unamae]RAR57869.1 hypothetical protein C7401_11488 [Paraburkholderia unamae]
MKKALLIYYTFTGEAQRVVELASGELALAGYEVATARVDFADPSLRLQRPLSPADVKRWTRAAAAGARLPVVVEPEQALGARYDLICLVSNTWQHHPCVPIWSLLARAEMRAALQATAFAVYVVCRRSSKRNLALIREEAEQHGGRFVGGERFEHHGSNVGSLIRTITYLMSSGERIARFVGLRLPLPPYGLSEVARQRVARFTRLVVARV